MDMKNYLSGFLIFIFFGCKEDKIGNTLTLIKDTILYKNGITFCKGTYLVKTTNGDTIYEKQKVWQYYFPNGTIWGELEFDNQGALIESALYYNTGILKEKIKVFGDSAESLSFNTRGSIVSVDKGKISSSVSNTSFETATFYDSGMLFEQIVTINDERTSWVIYDGTGKQVLNIINKHGRWINR
jgi:antitoxin component YwqK of YwqJK toxin-antitoxin module